MPAAESLPAELARILGAKNVLTAPEKTRAYTEELRGRHRSECLAVALPANVEEVSAVVSCCARAGAGIVPQGGNTGTMGGAVARRGQVILNLRRMNRVLGVDEANHSMHVQAGCVLADIQEAARTRGRLFPLSLGAQGSCQIGGNLATNAGGVNVLHYGNARDLALGLEVVLADGRIWSGLSALRKDNTGYDLKNLFIGSEGTLGVITAAVLKLFPALQSESVALAGLRAPEAALELLGRLRAATADRLVTFELMGGIAVHSVLRHFSGARAPLAARHEWYALLKPAAPRRARHCASGWRPAWRARCRTMCCRTRSSPKTKRRRASCRGCASRWWRRSVLKAAASSTMSRCRCQASPNFCAARSARSQMRCPARAPIPTGTWETATCISTSRSRRTWTQRRFCRSGTR